MSDGTGAVLIKEPRERPEDGGEWVKTPLFEQPDRVQQHEFLNELKRPHVPFGVALDAYLLAPEGQDPAMKDRLACHENNFKKAGIPARHLRFLTDLWASERLAWERTRHGFYGQVANHPRCGRNASCGVGVGRGRVFTATLRAKGFSSGRLADPLQTKKIPSKRPSKPRHSVTK